MADISGSASRFDSPSPTDALADRVRQRLNSIGVAFDRRAAASRPKTRRPKAPRPSESGQPSSGDSLHTRERACLRAVFHELGDAHRSYRARTGQTVTPALRAATSAFKLEPSLLSLVPVAAFLDELGILAW
jgi:hypothetical protein